MMRSAVVPASKPGPNQLGKARHLAHWAAQIPAAVASRLVDAEPDDSHSNLGWRRRQRGLFSHQLSAGPSEIAGARVGITLNPLALVVEPSEGDSVACPLDGVTVAEALESARELLSSSSNLAISALPEIRLRDYEMPEHELSAGVAFRTLGQQEALAELETWYEAFDHIFEAVGAALRSEHHADVSTARVWPHHFDLGLLATLQNRGDGPDSIGIGLSPGDDSFDQPYIYVSPYPWPEANPPNDDALPGRAFWNQQGFQGAILLGEALIEHPPEDRAEAAARFVAAAAQVLAPSDEVG